MKNQQLIRIYIFLIGQILQQRKGRRKKKKKKEVLYIRPQSGKGDKKGGNENRSTSFSEKSYLHGLSKEGFPGA